MFTNVIVIKENPLLPSGILREDVVYVMGNGAVVDIEHPAGEIKRPTDADKAVNRAKPVIE